MSVSGPRAWGGRGTCKLAPRSPWHEGGQSTTVLERDLGAAGASLPEPSNASSWVLQSACCPPHPGSKRTPGWLFQDPHTS